MEQSINIFRENCKFIDEYYDYFPCLELEKSMHSNYSILTRIALLAEWTFYRVSIFQTVNKKLKQTDIQTNTHKPWHNRAKNIF